MGEVKAVLGGLMLAKELGFERVEIESDCLAVIQALQPNVQGSSDFHLVIEDIFHVVSSFMLVYWSFVKWSENRVVHELAHFQPWESGKKV